MNELDFEHNVIWIQNKNEFNCSMIEELATYATQKKYIKRVISSQKGTIKIRIYDIAIAWSKKTTKNTPLNKV